MSLKISRRGLIPSFIVMDVVVGVVEVLFEVIVLLVVVDVVLIVFAVLAIEGLVDITVEQQVEIPQIQIKAKRDMLAKFGITIGEFTEFIDVAFAGDDICIFVFSTEVDDDVNRQYMSLYSDLAKEVRRNTKKINFVAYDLNTLGFNSNIHEGHPDTWLSPGS